jgi:hypothetical protein
LLLPGFFLLAGGITLILIPWYICALAHLFLL